VQLQKAGSISAVQAGSLNQTATQLASLAGTIWTRVSTSLYIPPGVDPGHFAQGATGNTLDTSQALDASGAWSALLAHANGDDTKALQCIEFLYQKFYLPNQQILESQATNSYNRAYQQLSSFSGCKAYNDSSGGYSGSPLSVWQEGTWGLINALIQLYGISGLASYFQSVGTSLDGFLGTLIASQHTVRSTTGDGSYLGYSLASRGLPWEFEVWPMLAPTAWAWMTAMNPSLLLSNSTNPQTLPYLIFPEGMSQSVNEIDGASSIGSMQLEVIDPGGVIKALASQPSFVGKMGSLRMGFPGQAMGDFVTLHMAQIVSAGFTAEGRMQIGVSDVQRCMAGALLWQNGGPASWYVGQQPVVTPPTGAATAANSLAVSDRNPRYVQGNPLDIFLCAMQNELGVGQDPSLPPGAWTFYQPGQDSTLINPNPYLDLPGILELRDGPYSGDWFEFKLTRSVDGKQWLEDQIMKVLGLYTIVRADGRLALKSMKSPAILTPVLALNHRNILGVPEFSRLPIINVVTVRFGVDDSHRETAARQYLEEITFQQPASISQYKQQFKHQIEASGLRMSRGGVLRAFLIADRIFRRHAFATPQYRVKTWLTALVLELGDFVWLNHPNVPDLMNGTMGLNNVVCEVVDRRPNYAAGYMEFGLLDTRFMEETAPYQIVPLATGIPSYPQASTAQRSQYMFVSLAASGGANFDGTPGNPIF